MVKYNPYIMRLSERVNAVHSRALFRYSGERPGGLLSQIPCSSFAFKDLRPQWFSRGQSPVHVEDTDLSADDRSRVLLALSTLLYTIPKLVAKWPSYGLQPSSAASRKYAKRSG